MYVYIYILGQHLNLYVYVTPCGGGCLVLPVKAEMIWMLRLYIYDNLIKTYQVFLSQAAELDASPWSQEIPTRGGGPQHTIDDTTQTKTFDAAVYWCVHVATWVWLRNFEPPK